MENREWKSTRLEAPVPHQRTGNGGSGKGQTTPGLHTEPERECWSLGNAREKRTRKMLDLHQPSFHPACGSASSAVMGAALRKADLQPATCNFQLCNPTTPVP